MPVSSHLSDITIFGASGLLGQALARIFVDYKPRLLSSADIDLTDKTQITSYIETTRPRLIINATGFTAVDRAETEKEACFQLNATAVAHLAGLCQTYQITLVHYSTDYIFDGSKKKGYFEDDLPQPMNEYGRSKLQGELEIRNKLQSYYLIRTSWLFGPGKNNFIATILKKAREKPELSVVADQWGFPTYSLDLASQTRWLLEQDKEFGIYHITNSGPCNWYEFAKKACEIAGIQIPIRPISTKDYPLPAKRPVYSYLLNNKIPSLRSWQDALKDYLKLYLMK